MVAYSNQQLNVIYSYIGFNFYSTFDPEIKSVIIATQATADGGTQPDGTLQAQVLSICNQLQTNIDANLAILSPLMFAKTSSSGSTIDTARADFMLRRQGRALIKQLCIIFGIKGVRQDYYSRGSIRNTEDKGMSYEPEDWK